MECVGCPPERGSQSALAASEQRPCSSPEQRGELRCTEAAHGITTERRVPLRHAPA